MKICYDAGLHELAVASGYPPNSIKNCSIFSRTHDFLLEAWQSLYQHFLTVFLQNIFNVKNSTTEHGDLLAHVRQWLQSFPTATTQQQCHWNLQELLSDITEKHPTFLEGFDIFMQSMASRTNLGDSGTICIWRLLGIGLFFWPSEQGTGTNLKMASIKRMAALFTAFDRRSWLHNTFMTFACKCQCWMH